MSSYALSLFFGYACERLGRALLVRSALGAQGVSAERGLFRHYWVLVKLVMNILATIVLLLYMQTLGYLADMAAGTASNGQLLRLRDPAPVVHAAGALVLLLVATTLSVYKPRGVTRYGQRRQHDERVACRPRPAMSQP